MNKCFYNSVLLVLILILCCCSEEKIPEGSYVSPNSLTLTDSECQPKLNGNLQQREAISQEVTSIRVVMSLICHFIQHNEDKERIYMWIYFH